MPLTIRENKTGLLFPVRVSPRSSQNRAGGLAGDALKLKLTAPPVDNAANRAVVEFFAKALGVAKSRVLIDAGDKSRNKTVLVEAEPEERAAIRKKLQDMAGEGA